MSKSVKIELSRREIVFQPSEARDFSRKDATAAHDLEVTVTNRSDRFVSFQLDLQVEGANQQTDAKWYTVEPQICAKKPPGARTTFQVTFLKAPIPTYDIKIPIIVHVLSVELASLSGTATFLLQIIRPQKRLRIYLPLDDLRVYPGDRLKIPSLVYNLNPTARQVTLALKELNPDWFPEGLRKVITIDAGESGETFFWCAPPPIPETESRTYPFTLEVRDGDGNSASTIGHLEVLPYGQVLLTCDRPVRTFPDRVWQLFRYHQAQLSYGLQLNNQSNLAPQAQFRTAQPAAGFTVTLPSPHILPPNAQTTVTVEITARRPWLGGGRTVRLGVIPELRGQGSGELLKAVQVHPPQQDLELRLRPIIPVLLQILGSLGALLLLWLIWWLNPRIAHTRPVNSIRLAASGTTVLSASSDQTIRRWRVNRLPWLVDRRRLIHEGPIETPEQQPGKSIRILRQLPNELRQVAAGLESGEIQLWQVEPPVLLHSFFEGGGADRVFGLGITQDSRYLFSGHGSGLVRQWDLALKSEKPLNTFYLVSQTGRSSAIASLAIHEVVGQSRLVAIAGQYNQLVLWDVARSRAYPITYTWQENQALPFAPIVNQHSYLTSIAIAAEKATMATADNEGFITLWDLNQLRQCMAEADQGGLAPGTVVYSDAYGNRILPTDCPDAQLSQWQAGETGAAIRDLALSDNACYLVSTGDDGRVLLWFISGSGQLAEKNAARQSIQVNPRTRERLNSVDIQLTANNVLFIASDAPHNRVQLYRRQVNNHGCP